MGLLAALSFLHSVKPLECDCKSRAQRQLHRRIAVHPETRLGRYEPRIEAIWHELTRISHHQPRTVSYGIICELIQHVTEPGGRNSNACQKHTVFRGLNADS